MLPRFAEAGTAVYPKTARATASDRPGAILAGIRRAGVPNF